MTMHAAATDVLAKAQRMGISLAAHGNDIHYQGAMTADLKAQIRTHKDQILKMLRGPVFGAPSGQGCVPVPEYKQWLWREVESARLGIAYTNAPAWVRAVKGPLCIDSLRLSLERLWKRHSALRARIFESDHQLYFATDGNPELQVVDLTAHNGRLGTVLKELRWAPFDPRTDALFRPFLIRLGAQEHVPGCVCHHFISDASSMNIIVNDWLAAYDQQLGNGAAALTEHPYQYTDYLLEMDQWCRSPGIEFRLDYWRRKLRRSNSSILPPDYELARDSHTPMQSESFSLDSCDTQRLRALASSIGVTGANLLLAANAVALSIALRTNDITLRSMDHGRWDLALLGMVGSTENPIPLRITLDPLEPFADVARRVQIAHLDAQANAVPWGLIIDILEGAETTDAHAAVNIVDRGASHEPPPLPATLSNGALPIVAPTPVLKQSLRHHPAHSMSGVLGTSFEGRVKFLGGLYRRETIQKHIADFLAVLHDVARDSNVPVGRLCK